MNVAVEQRFNVLFSENMLIHFMSTDSILNRVLSCMLSLVFVFVVLLRREVGSYDVS